MLIVIHWFGSRYYLLFTHSRPCLPIVQPRRLSASNQLDDAVRLSSCFLHFIETQLYWATSAPLQWSWFFGHGQVTSNHRWPLEQLHQNQAHCQIQRRSLIYSPFFRRAVFSRSCGMVWVLSFGVSFWPSFKLYSSLSAPHTCILFWLVRSNWRTEDDGYGSFSVPGIFLRGSFV